MLHVPEKVFFDLQQSLLLRMAATRYGRQLLCITDMGEAPVAIRPNFVQWRQSQHTRLTEVRTHNKYAKVIRHRWKEYTKYADFLVRDGLEESWRESRRAATRLGLAFVGGATVTTARPDPHPEIGTVDGVAQRFFGAGDPFSTIRSGNGTTFNDTAASPAFGFIRANGNTDEFDLFIRSFFLFDLSAVDDGDSKDSAIFSVVGESGTDFDEFTEAASIALVECTIASNTAIVNSDYQGTVSHAIRQATDKTIASLTVDSSTFIDFPLNATGLANVSLTDITKFGGKIDFDADNAEPTWGSALRAALDVFNADETGTSKDPMLALTHSAVAAAKRRRVGFGAGYAMRM